LLFNLRYAWATTMICHAVLVFADEPAVAPVTVQISDDALAGLSPYAELPELDAGPLPDEATRLDEIHPAQAEWINATFAGYPYRTNAHCRAGWPECIRPRAIPSNTPHYCGYYVGGGAAWWGEGRFQGEGTWGWDYVGPPYRKRISLDWWHGKYQGGTGQYESDGPKVLHHE
jgi:hypothetical protein